MNYCDQTTIPTDTCRQMEPTSPTAFICKLFVNFVVQTVSNMCYINLFPVNQKKKFPSMPQWQEEKYTVFFVVLFGPINSVFHP